ncbi:hypothetical protein BDQ17DRAFT_1392764 [Cyathus striatus]|nr:hypothetical protein BDQ17DRAFT_1392764 [Cyathus striatus]
MAAKRTLTWLAVLLGIFFYRSGHVLKNCILVKSPLPVGYVAGDDLKYCEDAVFWEVNDGNKEARVLLFSCDSGRKSWNTVMGPLLNPVPRGSLWALDPKTSQPQRITLKNYPEEHDFHPLGLEAYPSHDGAPSNLYVVNHARERTTIEQFIVSPKDLPDSFYVTNDHLFTRRLPVLGKFLPIAESILALPLGFVLHVNLEPNTANSPVQNISFAAPFIPFPNGVAISPSNTQVALVSTTLGKIFLYERDPITNTLTKNTHSITVPFTPDNIRYVSNDEIIVAGHPHFPSLTHVAANATGALAQSWVVRIRRFIRDDWTVETLFQSDGSAGGFGSSSTGLRDPTTGTVYVSGLYADGGVLKCQPGKGSQ